LLRGEGRNVGWSNETWFRAADPLRGEDVYVSDMVRGISLPEGEVTVGYLMELVRRVGGRIPNGNEQQWWEDKLGLQDYDPSRTILRLEAAVLIDAAVDPFALFEVNFDGKFLR
jgi:hypothetical protein